MVKSLSLAEFICILLHFIIHAVDKKIIYLCAILTC